MKKGTNNLLQDPVHNWFQKYIPMDFETKSRIR